jgi:ferritin-like metal-binding protein YciE
MLAFEVLPKLAGEIESRQLSGLVEGHLEQTREHAVRVEGIFRAAGVEPTSNRSGPGAALFDDHDAIAETIVESRLRDVSHASAAAQVERYEIGAYDALTTLAAALGLDEAVEPLRRNRAEEEEALAGLRSEHERLCAELRP